MKNHTNNKSAMTVWWGSDIGGVGGGDISAMTMLWGSDIRGGGDKSAMTEWWWSDIRERVGTN